MNNQVQPLVSICVPVYNTSQYLEQCLESLFNQTITEKCEFIIVNDCSTDNSADILNSIVKKYKNLNIQVITHEQNRGLAAARNTALDASVGKYCLNIDSDDWCELNYAEELVNIAEKENADIVNAFFDFTPSKSYDYTKGLLNHEFYVTVWSRLIKRDLFTRYNIKWIEGINVGEDVIISCKLFHFAKNIIPTPIKLYHYRTSIGFSTKLKKLKWLDQKQKEFSELERFFHEQNCYEKYKDIIDLRKAELKFDFIKESSTLSIKKYKIYYPEINLKILLEKRKDFNSTKTKFFINAIDSNNFILANLLLFVYKIGNIR